MDEEKTEELKINSITEDFIKKVEKLLNSGKEQTEIFEKLDWNKTGLSLVLNRKRNVPVEKWELLDKVFEFENTLFKGTGTVEQIISELKERVIGLEAQTEVYKTTLATILTGKEIQLSNDPLLISRKIEDLNSLIDDTINRKLKKL